MRVKLNDDGSATVSFAGPEDLDRSSSCIRGMDEPDGGRIGDEAYVKVQWPMAQITLHARCVQPDDVVLEEVPARAS